MLPLAGPQVPHSAETLAAALREGLTARNLVPREVSAQGAWPALDLLQVDLSGAEISRSYDFESPGDARAGAGFSAARFEIVARPGRFESSPVQATLHAAGAAFEFTPVTAGGSMLLLTRAERGEIVVEVAHADLERLIHSLASDAASPHGVTIKKTELRLVSRGPRAVSVTAEVTAKAFIATATVTLSGDIDLDEHLRARLSNLRFNGEGMVANLAGGFIRPQLAQLEGREFPLMSFALGEIQLRDIELQTGTPLRLSAQFAG